MWKKTQKGEITIHTLYCIIGKTGSGKTTITKNVADKLNKKILKSYTTRNRRNNETDENADHTFIIPDEVEQYRADMVAYTDRVGYCSFATKQQLMDADFYIINPSGYYELQTNTKDMDIRLVAIYITTPIRILENRVKKRGDFETWKENYINESEEFSHFEKSNMIDYRILNDRDIDAATEKLITIMDKDRSKHA